MATKKNGKTRLIVVNARAYFRMAFASLEKLPRKTKDDLEHRLFDNVYGTSEPDLEDNIVSTLDGWLKDDDE